MRITDDAQADPETLKDAQGGPAVVVAVFTAEHGTQGVLVDTWNGWRWYLLPGWYEVIG